MKTLSLTADKIWGAVSSTGNPILGETGKKNLTQEAARSLLEQSNLFRSSSLLLGFFWQLFCWVGFFKDSGWKYNIPASHVAYPTGFGIGAQCQLNEMSLSCCMLTEGTLC